MPAALIAAASAKAASATGSLGADCVSAAQASYRHRFDGGAGTATVSAVRPLCSGQAQTFSLLSYTAAGATFGYPQFIYDEAQATIDSRNSSVRLAVTVPGCYFQVDLIFGRSVYTEVVNADSNYGNRILGAPFGTGSRSTGPYAGDADGTTACSPEPTITYHNACNGTFTATLADDPSANVDAVFLVAGHRLRVAPGHAIAARRHTGTLTIRDNTFTTNIGTWEKPPTGCDPASPSTASSSAPAAPAPSAAGSPPAAESPEASTTEDLDAAGTALPGGPVSPSSPPVALRAGGTNSASVLVIALGVLLMGGGLIILFRVLRTLRRA